MRLKDKVAVVTGSTSGIGLATAKLFAAEGAKVVLAARKENLAQEIIEEIKESGGEAIFCPLEVTDAQQWDSLVETVKETYGKLHILVNNAGTNSSTLLPHIDRQTWDRVLAVDVTGPMLGIERCAPLMKESGGGSIVNIGSLAGMHGTASASYTTAKWALRGLSQSAAYTLGSWGIRSNTVHPGFIEDTNLTRQIGEKTAQASIGTNPLIQFNSLNRGGKPVELAQAVLFFASDESSYITGMDLVVDGGLHSAGIYATGREMFSKLLSE